MKASKEHKPQQSRVIQRVNKQDISNDMGLEFKQKHIAEAELPNLSDKIMKENALEAVYYHRDKNDRKEKQTIFFADSREMCLDLLSLDSVYNYSTLYSTKHAYPFIGILRVYNETEGKYKKADLETGSAKALVKLNKNSGTPSFNHLQKVDVEKSTKINLLVEQ